MNDEQIAAKLSSLTIDKAVAALEAIAAKHPMRRYQDDPANWVMRGGKRVASCLIGHLYRRLGILDYLTEWLEEADVLAVFHQYLEDENERLPDESAREVAFFLRIVQRHQDNGDLWPEAVLKAKVETRWTS